MTIKLPFWILLIICFNTKAQEVNKLIIKDINLLTMTNEKVINKKSVLVSKVSLDRLMRSIQNI